jgi:hypothetical protein
MILEDPNSCRSTSSPIEDWHEVPIWSQPSRLPLKIIKHAGRYVLRTEDSQDSCIFHLLVNQTVKVVEIPSE